MGDIEDYLDFEGIELGEIPPRSGIFAGIADVDSELATRLLRYNTHNRPFINSTYNELFKMMTNGEWELNGEPIIFDDGPTLLNGQHRLSAVRDAEGGKSYPMLVVYGITREAQFTMDAGARRAAHAQLHLLGIEANATTAAVIRLYLRWVENKLFGDLVKNAGNIVSTNDVKAWGSRNREGVATIMELESRKYLIGSVPASVQLTVAYRFHLIDPEAADAFFTSLKNLTGLASGSPIAALRNRLDHLKDIRTPPREYIAYYVMAWNFYRRGQAVSKLQAPPGRLWTPKNFPEPI